jgi:hypothetical protein
MGNRLEKLAKDSLFYLFLKLIQINFIFSNNVHILHMYVFSISVVTNNAKFYIINSLT